MTIVQRRPFWPVPSRRRPAPARGSRSAGLSARLGRAALLLLPALASRDVLAHEPPELIVEAPEALAPLASRLRSLDHGRLVTAMHLAGLDRAGPPIRIILTEEGSDLARAAPSWAVGYAHGESGTVVLIPSRTFSYPHGSLESLLHHEVAHVLIARAAGGRPVPRWFHEGVAMAAGRAWNFEDRARLVLEMLPGARVAIRDLDPLFDQGEAAASRAYALSGAFVRDLLQRQGPDVTGRILARVREGASFEEAFAGTTGTSLEQAEASFYKRQNLWSRWIPILTSSFTLWTAITILALVAVKRRRDRDIRLREQWEAEEAMTRPAGFEED